MKSRKEFTIEDVREMAERMRTDSMDEFYKDIKPGVGLREQIENAETTTLSEFTWEEFEKACYKMNKEIRHAKPTKMWKLKRNLRDL